MHRQFERIARRYDLTNDVISLFMHRLWKRRAVDMLAAKSDGSYLDVCCGTGDLALTIARRLCPQASVTGLDFSANMLAVAQDRQRRAQAESRLLCPINWRQGDAQALPFADDTFDGAIISFGLRNLTDLSAGLKEMARVVRPGGKVVNLDLGRPSLPLFSPVFAVYFQQVVPLIGALLQGDRQSYTYLPRSLATYPPPSTLTAMFQEAGLADVRWLSLALGSVALHRGTVV